MEEQDPRLFIKHLNQKQNKTKPPDNKICSTNEPERKTSNTQPRKKTQSNLKKRAQQNPILMQTNPNHQT